MLAVALLALLQTPEDELVLVPLDAPVSVDASVDLWSPWLRGGTRESVYGEELLEGTKFHFHDDLGLEDDDAIPVVRFRIHKRRATLSLEYWRHTWRGSAVLDGDSRFGWDVHPGGSLVESRFRLERIALDFSGPTEGDPHGAARTLAGLRSIRTRVEMDGPDDEHISMWRDIQGVIGFHIESDRDSRWVGRLSMTVGTDIIASWSAEIDAAAGVRTGAGFVEVGFRSFNYRAQIMSDTIDFSLTGPYVGVALEF